MLGWSEYGYLNYQCYVLDLEGRKCWSRCHGAFFLLVNSVSTKLTLIVCVLVCLEGVSVRAGDSYARLL